MFYKAHKCKQCRYRSQKKCSSNNGRRDSNPKIYAGDEHWTKVLQANEVNSNLVGCTNNGRKQSRCHCECAKNKSNCDKETNIFSSLYTRFCEWVANAKRESARQRRSSQGNRSRSGSGSGAQFKNSSPDGHVTPSSPHESHRCHHASVSSEDSELSSFYVASYSSTCSNLTLTSNSTTISDYTRLDSWAYSPTSARFRVDQHSTYLNSPEDDPYGSPLTPDYDFYPDQHARSLNSADDSCFSSPSVGLEYDRESVIQSLDQKTARNKRTKFARTKHPSVSVWVGRSQQENFQKHSLCATWPPTSHRKYSTESLTATQENIDLDGSVFESDDLGLGENRSSISSGVRESLGDCTIPFSDVEFGDCVRTGRRHEIYRGRWHGDVMIHTYTNLNERQVEDFWNEVTKLSMIRHENVALFMGACLEPPNFAVITSVLKGVSLYNHLHVKSEKMTMKTRIDTIRQVAQGMGYLHARGIVIRKLNSKNVYLEPKVKICVVDYGMAERDYDRPEFGCIPRGNLCYVSPEIMRTVRVVPPSLESSAPFTIASDVYAFGTLLYETLSGQFPFARTPPEVIIWQIGRGKRQSLKHLKLNPSLRGLIEKCWSRNPDHRVMFDEINKELMYNSALHKRHSSSNPERMNHLGLSDLPSAMFP